MLKQFFGLSAVVLVLAAAAPARADDLIGAGANVGPVGASAGIGTNRGYYSPYGTTYGTGAGVNVGPIGASAGVGANRYAPYGTTYYGTQPAYGTYGTYGTYGGTGYAAPAYGTYGSYGTAYGGTAYGGTAYGSTYAPAYSGYAGSGYAVPASYGGSVYAGSGCCAPVTCCDPCRGGLFGNGGFLGTGLFR
jgi:hypothetical protein